MKQLKAVFTAVFGTISSALGILAIPVVLLVTCNIIDYITGIYASKYRGEAIESYKGFRGIAKKVCMWLLIVIGAIVDKLLMYACDTIGMSIPFAFMFGCIVAIWLICNEIISILENIKDIGVPLPAFLEKVVKNIKSQVEVKAGSDTSEEKKEEE